MTVETHWSDIWLSADDWAEAFEAADPVPAQRGARSIWEELLAILMGTRRRRPGAPAPEVADEERGAAHDLQPGMAAARSG
jgi:hypothetical protein